MAELILRSLVDNIIETAVNDPYHALTKNRCCLCDEVSRNNVSEETPTANPLRFATIFHCAGAYLLGIVVCILTTPVGLTLAGAVLWPLYIMLAPIGCLLFYLYLDGGYLPFGGTGTAYWILFSIGFTPLVLEAILLVTRSSNLRAGRPWWIGFPIGFVGTLGVYYTAAASI